MNPPREVILIRNELRAFLHDSRDQQGRSVGSAKCGIYAFYDFDGEPIYVGQTVESVSTRIGRHLTGRRSDAVAKFVLDPFEVAEIEVWPLFDAEQLPGGERREFVNRAEFAVYQQCLVASRFGAVLNEGEIPESEEPATLPASFRGRIIPDELYEDRAHPDIRLARRAQTVASLARLISERAVSTGLRKTLLVQTQRLEWLARARLEGLS